MPDSSVPMPGSRPQAPPARPALFTSLALSTLLALLPAAGAATHLVQPDGGGDFPTIQAALTAAAAGDTVLLADGVFTGDGNRDLDPNGKMLMIRGLSGQAGACVIDCEGSAASQHRGFHFHSTEGPGTVVEDVTIRNGWGLDGPYTLTEAGAILCRDSSPTIHRCVFENNQAYFGGAIHLDGTSAPAILGCTFTGNYANLDGAGIACWMNTTPVIRACAFIGNTAGSRAGGLMADDDSAPDARGCTFRDNQADNGGGAIYCCGGSTPYFAECTLAHNAGGIAGGISCACHAQVLVERMIIAFSTVGQAVSFFNDAHVTLMCCDLYGNAGGDWVSPIADQYGINGNFSADPLFCDLGTGNLRLDGASPCLPRNHPGGDSCGVIGAWGVGCPGTGVEEDPLPNQRLWLAAARPNPSASGTTLRFTLADPAADAAGARPDLARAGSTVGEGSASGFVTLRIHDAAGRRVRTLIAGWLEPGEHAVVWEGLDAGGAPVPAGTYWCRLEQAGRSIARPLLRVR